MEGIMTNRCRIFKLVRRLDFVTHHVWQLFAARGQRSRSHYNVSAVNVHIHSHWHSGEVLVCNITFLMVFTARCYASAVLAMGLCLSVCLSQVGVLLKWLNVGSHKQHHTIARDSSLLMPKISAKFDRGHPLWGRWMQVGWVKIGDFWLITGYISKTVQDRHILPIKV